jgi:hypothetical protein
VLLHQAPNDRVGDRVAVDVIFAAVNLLLDLNEAHFTFTFPFPYRPFVPNQSGLSFGRGPIHLDEWRSDWTIVQTVNWPGTADFTSRPVKPGRAA